MHSEAGPLTIAPRRLILRDSVAFAILLCSTALLFALTLFLFRSFTARRVVLARTWAGAGSHALENHQPDAAITALRTALVYAPGTRDYEALLAQALGESGCAGCRDESYSYYMTLWESEPGNGSINLALARLARQRKEQQAAINFYRASIYGTWEGHGVDRRAEVRLELAGYLIEAGNFKSARLELLTAGTNAPDDFDRDMRTASMLQASEDPMDAWTYYLKAIADRPADAAALNAAGRLAYAAGDFANAKTLLARALEETPDPQIMQLMQNARRIAELTPSLSLSPQVRAERIAGDRSIAKKRFDGCTPASAVANRTDIFAALHTRWSALEGTANAAALERDPSLDDSTMQLVFDTEIDMQKACLPATGDDLLLLQLATSPHHALDAGEGGTQFAGPMD